MIGLILVTGKIDVVSEVLTDGTVVDFPMKYSCAGTKTFSRLGSLNTNK